MLVLFIGVICLAVIINAAPIKLVCPAQCVCNENNITQLCTFSSLKDLSNIDQDTDIKEVRLKSCNNEDLKHVNATHKIETLTLQCTRHDAENYVNLFTSWSPYLNKIQNLNTKLNCTYTKSNNEASKACDHQCTNNYISISSSCICYHCQKESSTTAFPSLAPTLSITTNEGTNFNSFTQVISSLVHSTSKVIKLQTSNNIDIKSTMHTTSISNSIKSSQVEVCSINCTVTTTVNTPGNNSNRTTVKVLSEKKPHKYNFQFLVVIGSLSTCALLLNFVVMTKLCANKGLSVIDLFGISLTFFNMILAVYGIAIAAYLSQEIGHWEKRFCQGFNSIKLFSLGSSVWTLIMLTFYHSIQTSTGEERDAVFKGIVYILEGVMLSGVFAVMSWIKLDDWNYICAIIKPNTTVEWLLTGIEIWYYIIALLLLLRYPFYLCRKKRLGEIKGPRYLNQEHPIFIMILFSFLVWVAGYIVTLPEFEMYSFKMSAVIRMCALIIPLIIQPIIFIIRNTCCCTCRNRPCSKSTKKNKVVGDDVLLVCECTGSETCHACESEFEPKVKYDDTMFTEAESKTLSSSDFRLDGEINGKVTDSRKRSSKKKKPKVEETKEVIKKNKKRKNKVLSSKAICRSPVIRDSIERSSVYSATADKELADTEAEKHPLLEKLPEEETILEEKEEKTTISVDDQVPLLDDTDGKPQPPKALPEMSPKTSVTSQVTDSPSRQRQTEFPSFINMETAVNPEDLLKQKGSPKRLGLRSKEIFDTTVDDSEGRVSRGPTFYPLAENSGDKKKKKRKVLAENISEDNNEDTKGIEGDKPNNKNVENCPKSEGKYDKTDKNVRKRKKKKKCDAENGIDDKNNETTRTNSTTSLEWDHTYSYSDSSGSGSVTEEALPGPVTPKTVPTTDKIISDKNNRDHTMEWEWDPSGCQVKTSPDTKPCVTETSTACEWEPYIAYEVSCSQSSSNANSGNSISDTNSNGTSADNTIERTDKQKVNGVPGEHKTKKSIFPKLHLNGKINRSNKKEGKVKSIRKEDN